MALRTIRKDNDEILRKKSKKIDQITERIEILVEDMIETMHDADGVGLAAVQVGLLKRLFVIDLYDGEGPHVFINPEIISEAGEAVDQEGCLSIPDRVGLVKRPENVKVKFTNLDGQEKTIEAEGLFARAICHENDHLNGILFTDIALEEKLVD